MRVLLKTAALFLLATAAWASARYFPLAVGNQWVLETSGPQKRILNIEVLRSRVANNFTYYWVTGYGAIGLWLRVTADGVVYALDVSSGRETRMASIANAVPGYTTNLSGCGQGVTPPNLTLFPGSTPPLTFTYAQGGCRVPHFRQEIYRYDIGLSSRTIGEADGTQRIYRLVYAKLADRVFTADDQPLVLLSDFNLGARGWLPGFAKYTPGGESGRIAESRPLPVEVEEPRNGYYLESADTGSGSFMFLKRILTQADGLKPNTGYELTLDLVFDSDAPSGCEGDAGAPGESVLIKAGASLTEPLPLLSGENRLEMNIDAGANPDGGADLGVVSDIANGRLCSLPRRQFVRLSKSYTHAQPLYTGEDGVLWLAIGADSSYTGVTGVHIESAIFRLKPLPGSAPENSARSAR